MDPLHKTTQAIAMLFAAGDVESLRRLWHPEIQVVTRTGREAAGRTRTAEVVAGLHQQHVCMNVRTVRTAADESVIEGWVVTAAGEEIPACWELVFRDGLLWRSTTVLR